MFFLTGGAYLFGGILFMIANLAFGASIVVYNSFLPDIAPPEERDAVSSKGWGIGYLGGGLLLALNLLLFAKTKPLGISEGLAVRINLASAGVWWALFTIIPLLAIRSRPASRFRRPGDQLTGSLAAIPRHAARNAAVSRDLAVFAGLSALQRCRAGRDHAGRSIRQRRAENFHAGSDHRHSDGSVCGVFRIFLVRLVGKMDQGKAGRRGSAW